VPKPPKNAAKSASFHPIPTPTGGLPEWISKITTSTQSPNETKLHDDWFDTQTGKDAPGAEGENGESKEDGSPGEGGGVLEEIPGLPDVQFDGPSIEFKGCGELKIKR
jgi:hypothetical protein